MVSAHAGTCRSPAICTVRCENTCTIGYKTKHDNLFLNSKSDCFEKEKKKEEKKKKRKKALSP